MHTPSIHTAYISHYTHPYHIHLIHHVCTHTHMCTHIPNRHEDTSVTCHTETTQKCFHFPISHRNTHTCTHPTCLTQTHHPCARTYMVHFGFLFLFFVFSREQCCAVLTLIFCVACFWTLHVFGGHGCLQTCMCVLLGDWSKHGGIFSAREWSRHCHQVDSDPQQHHWGGKQAPFFPLPALNFIGIFCFSSTRWDTGSHGSLCSSELLRGQTASTVPGHSVPTALISSLSRSVNTLALTGNGFYKYQPVYYIANTVFRSAVCVLKLRIHVMVSWSSFLTLFWCIL